MKNKKPLKIILLVFILELIVIITIGYIFQSKLKEIDNNINTRKDK